MQVELLDLEEIPRYDRVQHGDQFQNYLSDLALHSNKHTEEINRIKRFFPVLVEQSTLCDSLLLVFDNISWEGELLRISRDKGGFSQETSQVRKNSIALGRRLSMMADALNICFGRQTELDRRVSRVEQEFKTKLEDGLNEVKTTQTHFEQEIKEDVRTLSEREEEHWMVLDENIDKNKYAFSEELYEVKRQLARKIEHDLVKEQCKATEQRILKELNIFEGRNAVDPEEFDRFVAETHGAQQALRLRDVELQFDIKKINEHITSRLIERVYFEDQRTSDQKRLEAMFSRFEEIGKICFKNEIDMHNCVRTCGQVSMLSESLELEVRRVADVIDRLKLGDNFRAVIDSLEPQKIINIDSTLESVKAQLLDLSKTSSQQGTDLTKSTKELHELEVMFRAKQDNLDPQVIEPLLLKLLKKNYYLRMIERHQTVIGNLEHDEKAVQLLEKKVIVLERMAADPTTLLTMQALEEFARKELREVDKRLEAIDAMVREAWNQSKSKRHYVVESTITDQSFIRFKQLHPEPHKLKILQKDIKTFTSARLDSATARPKTQSLRKLFRGASTN